MTSSLALDLDGINLTHCDFRTTVDWDAFHRGHHFIQRRSEGTNAPALIDAPRHHYHMFEHFYLAMPAVSGAETPYDARFTYFSIDGIFAYQSFENDFGPFTSDMIFEFCQIVEKQVQSNEGGLIALRSEGNDETATNVLFLLGAYMIMLKNSSVEMVKKTIRPLRARMLTYRDISTGPQNFDLAVQDCWAGLKKAKELGWINFNPCGFDLMEYIHFSDPLNGDLHEIVPGKFIAMRGPKKTSNGQAWEDVYCDGKFSHRILGPKHYAEALRHFDVQAVIRLNEPEYPAQEFYDAGLAVADLFFHDCTCPTADIVAKFMMIAEGIPGPIAVHCSAGLGRTATLIALYMMAHYGFTAREAIGWLRIVRPGSVIGKQQDFLCDKEAVMRRAGQTFRQAGPACTLRGSGVEAVQALITESMHKVEDRLQAIKQRTSRSKPDRRPGSPRRAAATARAPQEGCRTAAQDSVMITAPVC